MSRPLAWGRALLLTAACALLAFALQFHRPGAPARRDDTPLRVANMWWAPQPLRYGIRSLHGRVVNDTDSVWSNVQVSIRFTGGHGESLYVRTVPMGRIEPRATAEFATGSLPDHPSGYVLYALSGTAVSEQRKAMLR